jgi:Zn-dependent M16 (insulinase) family peptidase
MTQRASQFASEMHGFRVGNPVPLLELRATLHRAVHRRTGLQVLNLTADDAENLFAAAFRTPPSDNTGVAHIVEHAVLGGSKRFPVKDPFLEMVKSSMATFINAMTYPDRTVYPVASNVRRDFFNLVDVYLDALFEPLLTPDSLAQEGHHLDFDDPEDLGSPLVVQGIVYNEMKGSFAELDTIIDREVNRTLLSETCYAFEAGGTPDAIPTLTFADFLAFFQTHYHPANARVFMYGDIPLDEKLAFLDARLAALPARPPTPPAEVGRQTHWTRPKTISVPYPVGPNERRHARTAVILTWLAGDIADPIHDVAMDILDHVLLGDAGAPLRKALVDCHLGEGVVSAGHGGDGFHRTFQVGLKGTEPANAPRIAEVVRECLQSIAQQGIPDKRLRAALNQLECSRLDIGADYPLQLMDDVLEPWLLGVDPLVNLKPRELFENVIHQANRNPRFFEELLESTLLNNAHCLTAVFTPKPGLLEEQEAQLSKTLEQVKSTHKPQELLHIAQTAERLRQNQDKPNAPENIARLPRLRRNDLPDAPRNIPTQRLPLNNGTVFLHNDLFTNGMTYLNLAFDLTDVSEPTRRIAPLLGHLMTRVGTTSRSFDDIAEEISLVTGGLSAEAYLIPAVDEQRGSVPVLTMVLQCCRRSLPQALDLLQEILCETTFRDTQRLLDVVRQRKVHLRNGVLPNGHAVAALKAGRTLTPAAALLDRWTGIEQLDLAETLTADHGKRIPELTEKLTAAVAELRQNGLLAASFTGTQHDAELVRQWADVRFRGSQTPQESNTTPHLSVQPARYGLREGLAAPSDVAYCARVFPAPHFAAPEAVPLQVFSRLLSYGYLWEEIRVKGGAYGGMCSYDPVGSTFSLMSYRDPSIARTLEAYQAVPDVVAHTSWSDDDVERALIGCAKHDERPVRPAPATTTALCREIGGITTDLRRKRWQQLIATTPADVRKAAGALLEHSFPQSNVCVLASEKHLREAARQSAPFDISPLSTAER